MRVQGDLVDTSGFVFPQLLADFLDASEEVLGTLEWVYSGSLVP